MKDSVVAGWRHSAAALSVVVLTIVLASARLLVNPSFYFADDTQLGAVGQWYELGDNLLSGSIPILSTGAWQGGNYLAEGQWGILNPLLWVVAIAARLSPDVLVFATIVKIAFLAIMSLGTYLLAREFGASRGWASTAGVLAPLGGFTAYMDAPSWVTGLLTTALLPWAWWGLLRVARGASPVPFAVLSYLLVTVGYVYGTIVLALVLVEKLIRSGIQRRRAEFLRVLAAAVWAGSWALVAYLPGVLTAPVTKRGEFTVAFAGFLGADLMDFGASAVPAASGSVLAWFGPSTRAPLVYIAWVLPLFALLSPWRRHVWRGLGSVLVLAVLLFAVTLGPSDFGPLRWPLRFMPYLTIAMVVIFAVVATRRYPESVSRMSVGAAAVASAGFGVLAWMTTQDAWRSILLCIVLQMCALIALTVIARWRGTGLTGGLRRLLAVSAIAAVTLALLIVQLRVFPVTPLRTFAVPAETSRLTDVLDDATGDVVTVGDALQGAFDEAMYDERLIANLWYFSPASVMNVYTVIPFSAFSDDLCIEIRGRTCDHTLETLFSTDAQTDRPVVDLLAVSEIVGYRQTYPEPPSPLPSGWRLVATTDALWRIARVAPVGPAGDVVWAGRGTKVHTLEESETTVSVRVDSVGDDPRVVLSRLAWPGYEVAGARLGTPVREYLLTVDLSDAKVGDVVTVRFLPPGLSATVAAAGLSIALLVGWVVLRWRLRRTLRIQTSTADDR